MGGYGSTRWNWHTKKQTVDDCRVLSIFDLKQKGVMRTGAAEHGGWAWYNAATNEKRASVSYELNTRSPSPFFRLYYTVTRWDGVKHDVDYHIPLEKRSCHWGGERWWFICPLLKNGRACNRRVGKLYLPPGGHYFGCRHCYDLTYRSSQESDKRVNALKKLGPWRIMWEIEAGEIDLLMGLKALPDHIWGR